MSKSSSKLYFSKVNDLMTTKYNAKIITKQQFSDAVYGQNDEDTDEDIKTLTEGLITNENAVFYLINNAFVINEYFKCVDPQEGDTLPLPTSKFMPYVLLVVELSDDKTEVTNYAMWTSFCAYSIFDELNSLRQ